MSAQADEAAYPLTATISNVGDDSATATFARTETDNAAVWVFYQVVKTGDAAPTALESVEDGQKQKNGWTYITANGRPTFFTASRNKEGTIDQEISSLDPGTGYTLYYQVGVYATGDESAADMGAVQSVDFTTTGEASGGATETGGDAGEDAGDGGEASASVMSLSYTDSDGKSQTASYDTVEGAISALQALGSGATSSDVRLSLTKDASYTAAADQAFTSGSRFVFQNLKLDFTFDLAGHKLTLANESSTTPYFLRLYSGSSMTIEDSSDGGAGSIEATGFSFLAYAQSSGAALTIKGGSFASRDSQGRCGYVFGGGPGSSLGIQGGSIEGVVNAGGDFSMSGGLIENGDAAMTVVSTASSANQKSFTMTGGTIRNTQTGTLGNPQTDPSAVYLRAANEKISITGGTIEAVEGVALKLQSTDPADESTATISGTAKLASRENAAVRFMFPSAGTDANRAKRNVLTVSGDAELSGDGTVFDFFKAASASAYTDKVDLNIEGGYFKFGDGIVCKPNSTMLAYPEGYVLNTQAVAEGQGHAGFYTLAKKEDLTQTVGTGDSAITVGYQRLDGLNTALASAKELLGAGNGDGTYDGTLWDAFESAYNAALPIVDDANANQSEIDWFANQLSSAQTAMIDNAQSGLDVSSLADGTYSVTIGMRQAANSAQTSMSDGAVDHSATIVVENGKGTIHVNFKPTYVMGFWGSLTKLWVYQGATPDEAEASESAVGNDSAYVNADQKGVDIEKAVADGLAAEASYLSYHTVDTSTGEATLIEGEPSEEPSTSNSIRPREVAFQLPYMGSNDDYNKIPVRVSVDVMSSIGVGDQDALMVIDYSTLKAGDDVKTSVAVGDESLELTAGSSAATSARVNTAPGDEGDYALSVKSADKSVARAGIDEDGEVTVSGVAAGETTVTVTATSPDGAKVTRDIAVKVNEAQAAADKTELGEQIASAADYAESDYTASSWKALEDALATAEEVAADDSASQEQVDSALQALSAAIGGLEKAASDEPSGVDTTEDGVYTVPVKAWNATQASQASMMDQALDGSATVTVEDGRATYRIDFKGVTIGGRKGHLIDLWAYPAGAADYGASVETDANEATVAATFEDTGLDGKAGTYARTFEFSRDAANEPQVRVRVHVDAMEGFNQDALLAFDWASLSKSGTGGASSSTSGTSKSGTSGKGGSSSGAGAAEKATSVTVGGVTCRVSGKTAVAASASKSLKKATVKASVKIGGKAYKVTSIKAKAFKGLKKLKSVVIGKNVAKIGKQAFQGAGKLKRVTFEGKKLKSVGSKAFKGIAKRAAFKAPKAKKAKYKKLVRRAGAPKGFKVK